MSPVVALLTPAEIERRNWRTRTRLAEEHGEGEHNGVHPAVLGCPTCERAGLVRSSRWSAAWGDAQVLVPEDAGRS